MKRVLCVLGLLVLCSACGDAKTTETCNGAGQSVCDGVCIDTQTDGQNCGGCNNVCGDGSTCSDGACTCGGGLTYCGGACVQTQSDDANCGICGNACRNGQICVEGACSAMAPEICNGEDDDLDGIVDEGPDDLPLTQSCDNLCGPGVETCNNGTFTGCTAPAPTAEVCDGIDNNCDGVVDEGVSTIYYEDLDRDGFGDPDLAFAVRACEQPVGESANGGQYVSDNTDCNDLFATANPDQEESCEDEIDNDCDGDINEDCPCAPVGEVEACGTDVGACGLGTRECTENGWSECSGDEYVAPSNELCSGEDEDCDGEIDERLAADILEGEGLNNTCETAARLVDAQEDADPLIVVANLYQGDGTGEDTDWYVVNTDENNELCVPGRRECGFYFLTQLYLDDADQEDYVVCIHEGECGNFDTSICSTDEDVIFDEETGSWLLAGTWDGRCGFEDGRTFFVEVRYNNTNLNYCDNYELDMSFVFLNEECE